jgi:translation initiation factor 2 alpha subunit (eIF-2alpha)
MEQKDFKKLLNDQTEEIKRHGKMLLEEFQSQLKVVAEVQVEQGKKLDDHTRKLDDHTLKLDDHTLKLDDHTLKLDALLEMVANNSENIELIKNMLKRKVDIDEFEALTKRVMVLEKKLLPLK